MKFTTKGEPPTELTCLICGKNEFDMTIQRNIEIPFPNSGPRTVRTLVKIVAISWTLIWKNI